MISFEEYSEYEGLEFDDLSDEEVESITSYIAYYKEDDDNPIKLLLLDDKNEVIASREFDDIDIAEVFLEDYFDVDEIEFAEEDLQESLRAVSNGIKSLSSKVKSKVKIFMKAMGQEKEETKQMAMTFFAQLKSLVGGKKPSKEEVSAALNQLKDLNKFAFNVAIFVLPLGTTTLITLQTIAQKFGISIFPSSFDQLFEDIVRNRANLTMLLESVELTTLPYRGFGISRVDMPQMDKKQTDEIIRVGIGMYGGEVKEVFANMLQMSQLDIDKDKIKPVDYERTIIVDKDYYILDGHHYVISKLNQNYESVIKVAQIDTDFLTLYKLAKNY